MGEKFRREGRRDDFRRDPQNANKERKRSKKYLLVSHQRRPRNLGSRTGISKEGHKQADSAYCASKENTHSGFDEIVLQRPEAQETHCMKLPPAKGEHGCGKHHRWRRGSMQHGTNPHTVERRWRRITGGGAGAVGRKPRHPDRWDHHGGGEGGASPILGPEQSVSSSCSYSRPFIASA